MKCRVNLKDKVVKVNFVLFVDRTSVDGDELWSRSARTRNLRRIAGNTWDRLIFVSKVLLFCWFYSHHLLHVSKFNQRANKLVRQDPQDSMEPPYVPPFLSQFAFQIFGIFVKIDIGASRTARIVWWARSTGPAGPGRCTRRTRYERRSGKNE